MVTALTKPHNGTLERSNDDDDDGLDTAPMAAVAIASTREATEVQAALTIAKRFPRDENTAYAKMMRSCKRIKLAEKARFAYPRGGQTISGPSIRLAEAAARAWGNIQYGIVEIERRRGQSQCLAFAWDVESNTRPTIAFVVRHERHTRQGVQVLTDERDINELILNQGARRLRNCLLKVIPSDLIDDALEECEKTLEAGDTGTLLIDSVKKCAAAFLDMGVTTEMLEARLGHDLSAMSRPELSALRSLHTAIRDGNTSAAEAFAAQIVPTEKEQEKKSRREELKDALAKKTEPAAEQPKPESVAMAGEEDITEINGLLDKLKHTTTKARQTALRGALDGTEVASLGALTAAQAKQAIRGLSEMLNPPSDPSNKE